MRYLVDARVLMGEKHDPLKHLDCPLLKRWDELQIIDIGKQSAPDPHPLKRHCSSCDKDVIDITHFDESQVRALLQLDPDACIHADSSSEHIEFIDYGNEKDDHRSSSFEYGCQGSRLDVPIVRTARSISGINHAAAEGFWPLIKPATPSPEIRNKLLVFQCSDGSVLMGGDFRSSVYNEVYWYNPYQPQIPFAAYLIPTGLAAGTRVFLPDLIEDIIGSSSNQGDNYRRRSGYATWNGEDLEIEERGVLSFVG